MRTVSAIVGAAGAGAVLAASVAGSPAAAEQPDELVSQAYGTAASGALVGEELGTGQYRATHDGVNEETSGDMSPPPIGEMQDSLALGALAQDATAREDGTSAACAGLIGADGTLQIGPDASCLVDDAGRVSLSLGSLDDLDLADLPLPDTVELPELPDLPQQLPPIQLRLEAESITAQCSADPEQTSGSGKVLDARIVGVLGDETIPILELPASGTANAGMTTTVADLLERLSATVPGLDELLDEIPREDLPTDEVIRVVTNEQVTDRDRPSITVTALHVEVVPQNLADVRVGRATCGPNEQVSAARPSPTPTPDEPEPEPSPDEPRQVPTSVPAGLASGDQDGGAGGIGWGAAAVVGLAGLTLGVYLHRRRTEST